MDKIHHIINNWRLVIVKLELPKNIELLANSGYIIYSKKNMYFIIPIGIKVSAYHKSLIKKKLYYMFQINVIFYTEVVVLYFKIINFRKQPLQLYSYHRFIIIKTLNKLNNDKIFLLFCNTLNINFTINNIFFNTKL